MNPIDRYVPVAVVERSGAIESFHTGVMVALRPDGSVAAAVGDPCVVVYPRSSNKPVQATAMVEAGLELPPDLLALACASHSGTAAHLAGVRRVLRDHGLDESNLANTEGLPIGPEALADHLRAGGSASRVTMNCSGKHAAMLATCVVNGWPIDESYLDAAHPLQRRITNVLGRLAGEEPAGIGVDGCGAPAHRLSLLGLARAMSSIVRGETPAAAQVARAMAAYPEMVGGPGRQVTDLMRAVPGMMAKDGADGVFIAALPGGATVAAKIADGTDRALLLLVAAGLASLGVDVGAFESIWRVPVLGHGHPVGAVRPIGPVAALLADTAG